MEKIPSIKKKKKRKRKFRSRFDRLNVFKKQLKFYMKKKKKHKQQYRLDVEPISNNPQLESSLTEASTMMDFQLVPDLSKRKYIYKDITLSNQNQMNWVSSISSQTTDSISSLANFSMHSTTFSNTSFRFNRWYVIL